MTVLPETWTELGEAIQKEEVHNSPDMPRDDWICLIPRLPELVGLPRFQRTDIDWYMRMPTDPPLVNPKVEMLLELCDEEDATLKLTFLFIVSQLPHWDG